MTKAGVLAAVLALALAQSGARAQPAAAVAPQPFVERFQAPAFDSRWILSDRWDSGEWPSVEWRASQTRLAPQGVILSLAPRDDGENGKPYFSGEISTRDAYRYGYFESRFRMPRGRGLVSAFFTFTREGGEETWNEIDMELLGRDPRRIELVHHVEGETAFHVVDLPFDASEDYHTYAFEWRPTSIRWYIDNQLVHVSRGPLVRRLNRPQRMFASLWNSARMPRWLGVIDPAEAPWEMQVACIAYAPRYEGRSLCID